MCWYLYLLFFLCYKKNSPSNISDDLIKKTTTVKYKMKYTKTTQRYPEKIGKSI